MAAHTNRPLDRRGHHWAGLSRTLYRQGHALFGAGAARSRRRAKRLPRGALRTFRCCSKITALRRLRRPAIAVAGVDMAAWDALARAANMPLCVLLGGSIG